MSWQPIAFMLFTMGGVSPSRPVHRAVAARAESRGAGVAPAPAPHPPPFRLGARTRRRRQVAAAVTLVDRKRLAAAIERELDEPREPARLQDELREELPELAPALRCWR